MRRYFKNEQGEVFRLTEDRERAAYLTRSEPAPAELRPASKGERLAFEKRRAAVWRVVQNNMGLCRQVLRDLKYWGEHEPMMYEVGIDVVLDCSQKWDAVSGAAWSTYLRRALVNGYLRAIRKERRLKFAPVDGAVEEGVELEARDRVQYLMEGLDAHDRGLLHLRFWRGLSLREIADVCGCAKSTASLLLKRALEKCRVRSTEGRPP